MTTDAIRTLRRAAAYLVGDTNPENQTPYATFLRCANELAAGNAVPGLDKVLGEARTVILSLGTD